MKNSKEKSPNSRAREGFVKNKNTNSINKGVARFEDNRPEASQLKAIQEFANEGTQVSQLKAFTTMAESVPSLSSITNQGGTIQLAKWKWTSGRKWVPYEHNDYTSRPTFDPGNRNVDQIYDTVTGSWTVIEDSDDSDDDTESKLDFDGMRAFLKLMDETFSTQQLAMMGDKAHAWVFNTHDELLHGGKHHGIRPVKLRQLYNDIRDKLTDNDEPLQ